MRRLVAGTCATLLLALAACGGGRPSVDEISETLQDEDSYSPEAASCVAEALDGSGISDEGLRRIVDDIADLDPADFSEDDSEAASDAILSCVDEGPGGGGSGGHGVVSFRRRRRAIPRSARSKARWRGVGGRILPIPRP